MELLRICCFRNRKKLSSASHIDQQGGLLQVSQKQHLEEIFGEVKSDPLAFFRVISLIYN